MELSFPEDEIIAGKIMALAFRDELEKISCKGDIVSKTLKKKLVKTSSANSNAPGSGARFKRLEHKIATKGKVSNPGAVAAAIGRKKYGKQKFQAMAAHGRKEE